MSLLCGFSGTNFAARQASRAENRFIVRICIVFVYEERGQSGKNLKILSGMPVGQGKEYDDRQEFRVEPGRVG